VLLLRALRSGAALPPCGSAARGSAQGPRQRDPDLAWGGRARSLCAWPRLCILRTPCAAPQRCACARRRATRRRRRCCGRSWRCSRRRRGGPCCSRPRTVGPAARPAMPSRPPAACCPVLLHHESHGRQESMRHRWVYQQGQCLLDARLRPRGPEPGTACGAVSAARRRSGWPARRAGVPRVDREMFRRLWGPTVAAVSVVLDQSEEPAVVRQALDGLLLTARIAAHHHVDEARASPPAAPRPTLTPPYDHVGPRPPRVCDITPPCRLCRDTLLSRQGAWRCTGVQACVRARRRRPCARPSAARRSARRGRELSYHTGYCAPFPYDPLRACAARR